MKNQSLILLAVAGGCGLIAMIGVKQLIDSKPTGPQQEMVKVLCAASEINAGERLDELNTHFVEVNRTAVPEGAILDLVDTEDRALRIPASPGDWITQGKLTEKGDIGAVANIPDGMRVKTIPVDGTQIHSGMLRPGNRIDISLSYAERGLGGRTIQKTRTVLQYVEVFAVDDRIYGRDDKEGASTAKHISLLTTPEQAALLDLCMNKGKLSTTLRSNGDKSETASLELSDEALGIAASGAGTLNESMLEHRDRLVDQTEPTMVALEPEDPALSIADQLQDELKPEGADPEASAPVIELADASEPEPKNVWIMEIHEGTDIRLESIELLDAEANPAAGGTGSEGSGGFWDFIKSGI